MNRWNTLRQLLGLSVATLIIDIYDKHSAAGSRFEVGDLSCFATAKQIGHGSVQISLNTKSSIDENQRCSGRLRKRPVGQGWPLADG